MPELPLPPDHPRFAALQCIVSSPRFLLVDRFHEAERVVFGLRLEDIWNQCTAHFAQVAAQAALLRLAGRRGAGR